MPDSKQSLKVFDRIADSFARYGITLRGYVRYQVTRRNLAPFLNSKSLKILDIGGGNGTDAAWLVSMGHHVTIVETSREQCLFAERRFDFLLKADERALITMFKGELSELSAKPGSYDVVLCHGVAMYQPNPREFIAEVVRWAKPGGVVSLLEKGYYGAEARAVCESNFDQLASLQATQTVTDSNGIQVHAFTPDALEVIIEMTGASITQWSGVRVVSDSLIMQIADYDTPVLDTIIEAEYTQGKNPGIRSQGQMLHFIARA